MNLEATPYTDIAIADFDVLHLGVEHGIESYSRRQYQKLEEQGR